MTPEQVQELVVGQDVIAGGQTGTIDRISGTGEVFVWFGQTDDQDTTMRIGVIGFQPSEVELA